jgi:hypothetical protein
MTSMIASLIFAAATATATPAAAPASTPAAIQASAPAADDDKLVCKYTAPLGSRLPVRTCKTKGQMAREAQEAKELTRTMQNAGPEKSQ